MYHDHIHPDLRQKLFVLFLEATWQKQTGVTTHIEVLPAKALLLPKLAGDSPLLKRMLAWTYSLDRMLTFVLSLKELYRQILNLLERDLAKNPLTLWFSVHWSSLPSVN